MGIDPLLFKRPANPALAIAALRVSKNPVIEAKANAIVKNILASGAEETQTKPLEKIEEIKNEPVPEGRFVCPSANESGLVNPDITLDESQVAAIDSLVGNQYGCLIGAAGTGKTTSQRFLLQKLIYGTDDVPPTPVRELEGKQSLNIALCAFTGIATQVIKSNMPKWLWPACKTIHSLLEYAPVSTEITTEKGEIKEVTTFQPMRHMANKFQYDIIIIDEASMVGLDLWHQILDACQEGTRIILTGDINQLPPVMGASMFAYALSEWPVSELTHVHRQKEPAANKIIDVAHAILQGKEFTFDDARTNANWRVIGFELDNDAAKAGVQIVGIANNLRGKKVAAFIDPTEPDIYDPYRDRIITAGNGFDENDSRSALQQSIINEALSQLIEPPSEDHPRFIIDAGRERKKFALGHRVMATRNEPPTVVDRVTNGMVGRIIGIEKNFDWEGNHALVGPEHIVKENQKLMINNLLADKRISQLEEQMNGSSFGDDDDSEGFSFSSEHGDKKKEGGGPASHKVKVEFVNGAVRTFASKASVESLYLAYASTCHKCQGSQMDTAIIVVHHLVKSQLSREWFYTAVTRATKRVIILHTKYGIRCALAKQKIFGSSLQQKIQKYKQLQEEGAGMLRTKVRLYI